MSKINNVIVKEGQKLNSLQHMLLEVDQNKVSQTQQKLSLMNQTRIKESPSASRQSSSMVSMTKKDYENFRFSRFQPWHLTHMAENAEVQRKIEQDRGSTQKNLQQLNSDSQEDEQYFYTPTKHKSFSMVDKKLGMLPSTASNKKKSNFNNIISERKARPKQKGLRKLSGKAFKIVKELGEVTYKTVALKLIKEIQEDDSEPDDEREENNIKRRVYDALNVLIAMGILKKKGRNIVYELDAKLAQQQSIHSLYREQKQKLIEREKIKEMQISKKKNNLKTLHKIKLIKQLIIKNKNHTLYQINRIDLPFICFEGDQQSLKKIMQNKNKQQLKITTKFQYSFFGDIKFLLNNPISELN